MAFFARRILATLVALGLCGSASAEDITSAFSIDIDSIFL